MSDQRTARATILSFILPLKSLPAASVFPSPTTNDHSLLLAHDRRCRWRWLRGKKKEDLKGFVDEGVYQIENLKEDGWITDITYDDEHRMHNMWLFYT
ncbi:hypothetical protein M9H77_03582 [Catharanthus roseus]|uniref:Uncharacterized protein n=1 Tax=Catharanthus roseus TaxID=4058 RepID=A0ACC0CBN3_CATRO|nr:hypothetical protein M9H77_03582 [Catharanthus roseus]